MDICKLLIAHGSWHDHVDENGETPLYYSIRQNRGPIVEWLLSHGCNMNIINNKGQNLVRYAEKNNKPHIKEILIKHGAPQAPNP